MSKLYAIVLMILAFVGGVAGGLLYHAVMSLPKPEAPQINIEIPGEPLRHVQVPPTLQPVEPFLSYSKEWPNGPPPVVTPPAPKFLEQVEPFVVEFREGHWVQPTPVIEASDRLPPPTVPTFVTPKPPIAKPSRRNLLDRLLD